MLRDLVPFEPSPEDQAVFHALVPYDHFLRRAARWIDFAGWRNEVAGYYSADQGRPAEEPLLMLKLEFLQYHDNLSDRQVIARSQTDVAYRWFLGLGMNDPLPDPSSLSYFRGRLGVEGHQRIFDALVGQAREHGLVKDRLRIKDATHVVAAVAIPSTLALVAQAREKLLAATEPFDALRVEGERARAAMLHGDTQQKDEERLLARVTHLREILAWVEELPVPRDAARQREWDKLQAVRRLAHKILADQEDPKAGDQTRSAVDPDARRSKHGQWYDGFLLDVLIDADSELFTAINVLPANGDEAADAAELVRREEAAHGNDVQGLSIDGAGFNGPLLRELEDPAGLALEVYVPPKEEPANGRFGPEQFVEDAERGVVRCPAGQESRYRERDSKNRATIFRFARTTCTDCPQRSQCMEKAPGHFGRSVRKNDYQAEYDRVRQKAQTAEYAAVRKQHPKVERKLSELVCRHGGRHARYRGCGKVLCQGLMTGLVANVKRVVRLLCAQGILPALC
jgi:transposase